VGADLGMRPGRAPGGFVFEEQVGVGVHNARASESTDVWVYKQVCVSAKKGRRYQLSNGFEKNGR